MSVLLALGGLALLYFLGYRGYSVHLARKVFGLSDAEITPAHKPRVRILFQIIVYFLIWIIIEAAIVVRRLQVLRT